jgi:hypothetical protein
MMNFFNRAAAGLTLALALTVSTGCMENIALVGRPTLEEGREDIVGEVARVDTSSRQIYLRATDSRTRVVGYSANAQVVSRGRDYAVTQLEPGDLVAMQVNQDSRGNYYTDLIRVQESIQDRNQSRRGDASPGSRIQTLDGRVEQLDFQRRSFEIRDQSRERVIVSLPSNAERSDVDRFRALRDGDYVRVEGRFLDRQRFELATFLRDNR